MDLIAGAEYRKRTNLGMLETMQDPRNGPDVLPPNQYHNTSFSKDLVVIGSFVVDDTLIAASDTKVATSTGIILWLTAWGTNSIYRMGFVPAGITSLAGVRGLDFASIWGNVDLLDSITWNNPFPLPYGVANSFPDDQVAITGDLEATFNIVRAYSGVISLKANTISTTNFSFNGTLAAGALADTRDISQHVVSGSLNSGQRTSYSEADLQQTSVTKKDFIVQGSLLHGAVALLASDIQPLYSSPNPNNDYKHDGEYQSVPLSNADHTFTTGINNEFANLFQAGVSVADLTWNQSPGSVGFPAFPPMDTYRLGAIGELDQLAFKVSGKLLLDTIVPVAPTVASAQAVLAITAHHVFAVVHSDHNGYFTVVKETKMVNAFGISSPLESFAPHFALDFDPFFGFQSFTTTGKYVGTLFSGQAVLVDLAGGTTAATLHCSEMLITCIAKQLNIRGNVGYARVLRYDNVSNSVNLRVEGVLNIQCVPQGSLAPYVKGEAATHEQAVDLNVIPLSALCYNSNSSLFRRIWVMDDYLQMLQDGGAQLDPERIVMAIKDQPAAMAAAQAAGIFDWLRGAADTVGSALGHVIAPIGRGILNAAAPVAGGILGAATNALADRALSAIDRFAGRSAGQFGQSAGQFGYSAGQFGQASGSFGATRRQRGDLSQYR